MAYVANGSHANYFFGPSRYPTITEALGARVTTDKLPFSGDFTDFTTSLESGFRTFPELKVVPAPVDGSWTGEWRWLNFRGKWGSKGMPKFLYLGALVFPKLLHLVRWSSPTGEAPGSIPERSSWSNPFEWADRECIDALPPMDNWLLNEHYQSL